MANINWRTINIDALDSESAYNFDLSTLTPAVIPVSTSDVQTLSGQIRQLMRGGDNEGALRGALENVPYGADEQGKVGPLYHIFAFSCSLGSNGCKNRS
jgi:actin related protein 2/3 complex subunit 5